MRLNDIPEMVHGPSFNDTGICIIRKGFFIGDTIITQEIIHVIFCPLTEITVKDQAEYIVLKL